MSTFSRDESELGSAKRTIEVLKRRVVVMQNGSQSTIQRQLEAAQLQLSALSRDRQSPAVKKAVPQELVDARAALGLCIKCGVEPYSRGGNSHNARTCKQPADLTTYPKGAPKPATQKKPVFRDARQ